MNSILSIGAIVTGVVIGTVGVNLAVDSFSKDTNKNNNS